MGENYFTGSFDKLFHYWQDEDRAKKFTAGGSRVQAVRYLLTRAEPEIHKGLWIDTAVGAGFPQNQLYGSVVPCLLVGIDFSRAMLDLVKEPVQPILGSAFKLPVRTKVANLATNIFCLSDYPNPKIALKELSRITQPRGIAMFLDYSTSDQYWKTRQESHDGKEVIGNINLRNPNTIAQYLPDEMSIVQNIEIMYEVDTASFDERVDLPPTIHRAFLFVEMYKPRSIKD